MPRREGAGRPKLEYAAKHGLSKADTLRKAVNELLKRDKKGQE